MFRGWQQRRRSRVAGQPPLARSPRWWVEVGIVGAFYLAYERGRVAARARPSVALRNASHLINLEQRLHIDPERSVNRLFASHATIGLLGGYYYATLHFVVTVATLVWLYLRRPAIYRRWRRVLALSSFGALFVFWRFPVAPPRLAIRGLTDILVTHNVFGVAHTANPGGFVNIYAAIPSLHVGWAVWAAGALVAAYPDSRWRHGFWLYPIMTTTVVLGTANHYLIDAAAGGLLVVAAYGCARLAERVPVRVQDPWRTCSGGEFRGTRRLGTHLRSRELVATTDRLVRTADPGATE